ncbi:hypothetical protein, partial [uncultured Cyclobacterium sp.]|uniref:hypothetical protein n=1 Tax=uncultured Cyclobacterium sp. TaxID=453820 RepID=UPI0030EDEC5B
PSKSTTLYSVTRAAFICNAFKDRLFLVMGEAYQIREQETCRVREKVVRGNKIQEIVLWGYSSTLVYKYLKRMGFCSQYFGPWVLGD